MSRQPWQMVYFLDDGVTPSQDADFIKMAIKDGLIDSIHSWGDFNDAPPEQHILKKLAKRLTGSLRADDLQVKVWNGA
jgi:hypothetical protein